MPPASPLLARSSVLPPSMRPPASSVCRTPDAEPWRFGTLPAPAPVPPPLPTANPESVSARCVTFANVQTAHKLGAFHQEHPWFSLASLGPPLVGQRPTLTPKSDGVTQGCRKDTEQLANFQKTTRVDFSPLRTCAPFSCHCA